MPTLRSGEVARLANVNVETLRFYERQGLLPRPPQRASGYREYPPEAVNRVRFIQRAKELGFTLNEVKELLSLRVDPGMTCVDVRARAEAKIADIEGKIETLRRMRKALRRLTEACGKAGDRAECPILDALDGRPRLKQKDTST